MYFLLFGRHVKADFHPSFSNIFILMKPKIMMWSLPALIAGLCAPMATEAATIWNGPLITFTQGSPYPNPPSDRDPLTPNVALTRTTVAGIFNVVAEAAFTKGVSPAGTEWAVGPLDDYAGLIYRDWTTAGGGNPVLNLPGQQLVVHLIADDIYLSLKFTALGGGGTGGFSYIRSTPAVINMPPSVSITNPITGASFFSPATVTLQATASDSDGSVTNVEFFDGATSLGRVGPSPYAVTVSLAVGSHALTAVATDNLGL